MQLTTHGPCLSDIDLTFDNAFCFHLRSWPEQAKAWIYRHRSKEWPSDRLVESIVGFGCLIVPVCPKYEENETEFWRISFSMAEKQLSHSFNYVQFLCYSLLKLTLKNIINKNVHAKDMLCSYFMKTALFWVSEVKKIQSNVFEYQTYINAFVCVLTNSWDGFITVTVLIILFQNITCSKVKLMSQTIRCYILY